MSDATKTAASWIDEGTHLYDLGHYQGALDAYAQASALDPNYAASWIGKGNALDSLGHHEEALEAYEQAITLDTNNAAPWHNKGIVLDSLCRHEEALDAFEKAIAMDTNLAAPWHGKGIALYSLGRHEEALDAFEKAIAMDPNYATPWHDKGNALRSLGRPEEALDAYAQAIELGPLEAAPWLGKGKALRSLGRYQEALDAYAQAIALAPQEAAPWLGKGTALDSLGRHEEALDAFEKAIAMDPNYAAPWHNKGNALSSLGRHEEAYNAYTQAIALDPNLGSPWLGKGNALHHLDRYQEALDAYAEAIALDSNLAASWHGKGNALHSLGRHQDALDAYEQAIALDPNVASPWHGKTRQLWKLERFIKAQQAVQRFCFLAKDSDLLAISETLLHHLYHRQPTPLLLLRLRRQTPRLLAEQGWFEAVCKVKSDFAVALDCLERLETAKATLPSRERLRAAAGLTLYLGDAVAAERGPCDALDDDFPEDLFGQYYLLASRQAYCAELSATLEDALEAAGDHQGEDPEQHYYAAKIFLIAQETAQAGQALERAGEYVPALFLRLQAALDRQDTAQADGLAGQILRLERKAAENRRFLRYRHTPIDLTTPGWLDDMLHWARQNELATPVQTFLTYLENEQQASLRATFRDVLPETFVPPLDILHAWKLNAASQRLLQSLADARYEAELAELREELEEAIVNFSKVDATPDDRLEAKLVKRLEAKDVSLDKERLLISYFLRAKRLSPRAAFTLRLYALAQHPPENPRKLNPLLINAFLAALGGAGGTLASAYYNVPTAMSLASFIGTGALTLATDFMFKRIAATKSVSKKLDFGTFKQGLKDQLQQKKYELSALFSKWLAEEVPVERDGL